ATMGAVILLGDSLTISSKNLFGDMLGLITAFFYAGYIVSVSRLRSKFSSATFMAWGTLVTVVFLFPVAWFFSSSMLAATLQGWLILLGLAWFSHTGGQGMIAYALAHLPAAFSSVVLLMQPVIAAIAAWLILSEGMSPWQFAGAAVILCGVYLARRGSR
ncbi:MAG: EamA family transporter, partial [Hyphomicrobiales bacterium]